MEEFLLFFLSVFVLFILIAKLFKNKEIISLKSEIDGRTYIVRKLPNAQLAADKLASLNQKLVRLINSLDENEKDGIDDLKNNYNPDKISETGLDAKYTSYSVNKGEKIVFCLRMRDKTNRLVDENTLTYVAIHELGHLATKEIGHVDVFWTNFKWLLQIAVDNDLYNYVNYSLNPQQYCGLMISSNVLNN